MESWLVKKMFVTAREIKCRGMLPGFWRLDGGESAVVEHSHSPQLMVKPFGTGESYLSLNSVLV
jgi:hypothetical protein